MRTTSPGYAVRPPARNTAWAPPVDVVDTASEYILRLDVPGVDENAVNVELERGVLRVTGERKANAETGYTLRERRSGAFARIFRLPDAINAEAIAAKYDRGVLEIRIPKVDRSRKIPIQ
jgi:HSP20 family protein